MFCPPLTVFSYFFRIFALQFLLVGKENHMTMCFQVNKSKWKLYDNDAQKPPFQPFDLESLKDYEICMAGYVNITLERECKFGNCCYVVVDILKLY